MDNQTQVSQAPMKKCNKCDERGHIYDGKGGGQSCDCGYYQYLMKKRFENVSIADLFAYGRKRIEEKQKLV